MTSSTSAAPADAPAAPVTDAWDPRPGGALRSWITAVPSVLLFALTITTMSLTMWLWPSGYRRHCRTMTRTWGRLALRLVGVKVEVTHHERVLGDEPRVVMFNHQSLLDLAILARFWPARGVVLYKQEFHKLPMVGGLLASMGVAINRGRRREAIASLDAAVKQVHRDRAQVLVSPEGTRSHEPGLLPFKRGPFHMALQTRAPVVPFVMRGVRGVMPHGSWCCRSGTLRVDFLEPIPTADWSFETLDRHMAEVRARFEEVLGSPR